MSPRQTQKKRDGRSEGGGGSDGRGPTGEAHASYLASAAATEESFASLFPVEAESEAQTIIGSATLVGNELRLDTNSNERADALRARLEQACGGLIVYQTRDQEDPLAPRLAEPAAPSRAEGPPASPAAVEAMRNFKRQHYQGWADQRLPALAGKTPRDAIRSAEGRAAVDLLLKDFEYQENRSPPEARFDMSELRRALGLLG